MRERHFLLFFSSVFLHADDDATASFAVARLSLYDGGAATAAVTWVGSSPDATDAVKKVINVKRAFLGN